ncbi:hypothetical protein BSPWISOXPB_2320 [uncultured Gammaproteobacteria bacterium]|nr:hypothetical protein BSPWISOXPB_2320 [uncultured Gammaproteobacteria bacterium]
MYILAKFVSKYPMSKKVRPTEIVAEFEGIILNELNMLREAKNATQLRENFQVLICCMCRRCMGFV